MCTCLVGGIVGERKFIYMAVEMVGVGQRAVVCGGGARRVEGGELARLAELGVVTLVCLVCLVCLVRLVTLVTLVTLVSVRGHLGRGGMAGVRVT